MKTTRSYVTIGCAISILSGMLLISALYAQDSRADAVAKTSAAAVPAGDPKEVSVGTFAVKVPTEWTSFDSGDAAALRQQVMEQSKQIYQQFSGADDPTKLVDVAAFHMLNDDGSFIISSFTVPPQSDLITLLKSQVAGKMEWGVREGYIRKYLGLASIDNENFSGFYTKAIGKDGGFEVSGGLEYKRLKNTVIQLTLLCPNEWNEAKAVETLSAILKNLTLKGK